MKKIYLLFVVLFALIAVSINSFAEEIQLSYDDARDYLINYCDIRENSDGKLYTIQYLFNSEEDLDRAANYVVEYGVDTFNYLVETSASYIVSQEPVLYQTRSAYPNSVTKTITGNGRQYVSAEAYGLASFDTIGTVEYSVQLGYYVTASNGTLTNLSNIYFNIPYLSTAGSWGNLRLPSYCTGRYAGVTANYDVIKTIEVGISNFTIVLKTEIDNEVFALLTILN